MTALPAPGVWGDTDVSHTKADLAGENEDVRDWLVETILGASVRYELTVASGAVTPPDGATAGGAIYKLDTEGNAATDDLTTIAQTNTHDGQILVLMAETASRVVTVKHAAGGTGQVLLTDSLDFVLDTVSKWIMLRRDGTDWVEFMRYGGADFVGVTAGQCRLDWTSTSALTLSRFNGSKLFIGGAWRTVPSTGPTLSNATALIETGSLANNTTYYVYAYMVGTTLTLGASATAPAVDTNYGHKIRTGDAGKTLVGLVRTNGSAQFSSADLTLSWLNQRRRKLTTATLAADATGISSVASTGVAVNFLTWASELVVARARGFSFNSGSNYTYTFIGFDSSSLDDGGSATFGTSGAPVAADNASNALSEGYHTATVYGLTSGGTGSWDGSASAGGQRLSLMVEVSG